MWNYVKKKFIIPENGRKIVLNIINDAWRKHKHDVKKNYFDLFKTNKARLKNPPDYVPVEHFKMMINFWKRENIQKMCAQNAKNNSKRKWKHRKGKLRFSLIKAHLRANNENNQEPSQSDMFIETRTKGGIALDDETQTTIGQLKDLVDTNGKTPDEAFHEVFGEEKPGRVRCFGRTATPTILKKNKEIAAMGERHAAEIASLKEKMEENQNEMEKKFERIMEERDRKMEERENRMRSLMKDFLTQANPAMDISAIEALIEPLTPRDANSGFLSSTAMHNPVNEEDDEIIENEDEIQEGDDDDDDDGMHHAC